MDDNATYSIIRLFCNHEGMQQVISTGMTLEEAKTHCNDPETSSRTCTSEEGHALTAKLGPWFDGFQKEE